jgi:biotin carboxyl carrier protein
MVAHSWIFDQQETKTKEGAVINWENDTFFTLTFAGKLFHGEIVEDGTESNFLKIKINHLVVDVRKKGALDDLISALGMDVPKVRKLKELQAPMPGRIVNIAVSVGQELAVGDEILSLEAMKMENVLKAEGVGIVKAILISSNQVVDKGSVLIEFE